MAVPPPRGAGVRLCGDQVLSASRCTLRRAANQGTTAEVQLTAWATTTARKAAAKKAEPARAAARKATAANRTAPAKKAAPAMEKVPEGLHVPTVEELREMVGRVEVPTVGEARVDVERFVDHVRSNAERLVVAVGDMLARIEIQATVGALREDTEKCGAAVPCWGTRR